VLDLHSTATNGRWKFTGSVDPDGLSSRVLFEVATGQSSSRNWTEQMVVADGVTSATPLQVETTLPEGVEICVRFTMVNEAGRTSSKPLCMPAVTIPRPSTGPSG
jgi:hypothetical protein